MTTNINKTTVLDYGKPSIAIPHLDTDGVMTGQETPYQNTKWTEQWGAYTSVSEFQNLLLMKAYFNTGKGWTADTRTTVNLNIISGNGKQNFSELILNADVVSMLAGDSYMQVIRQDGIPVNLKALNPGVMKVIYNDEGRIVRYEQTARTGSDVIKKFKPDEIFHLSFNRMADSLGGTSIYDKLKPILQADEKVFAILQKVMAHQAIPFILWKLKTDDQTKIDSFASKVRQVREKYGDLFVPDDEGIATWQIVEISPSQLLLEYWNELRNKLYRAAGLPQIVPGGGEKGTGSESRTIYLAFEQLVAQRQKFIEDALFSQLGIEVKFYPPTTMMDLLGETEQKTNEFAAQQSEINPSAERQ